MPSRPLTTIVVTPVLDEAWILDRFIRCASLWADHIVIADQRSRDGSREIAARHPKVILIDNPVGTYDEAARQQLLLDAARAIPGRRLIFALDADEILSPTWQESAAWHALVEAQPGTVVRMNWANVLPGFGSCWVPPTEIVFGYVDDGADHAGSPVHSVRLPEPASAPTVTLRDVRVMHYQYTNWQRMQSKQRWYQAWEWLNVPRKRPIQLYRQYHHMNSVPDDQMEPLPTEWISRYEAEGIDMTTIPRESHYRWDEEVLTWIQEFGPDHFRRLDLWDVDWNEIARASNGTSAGPDIRDPRGVPTRLVHRWLAGTQGRAQTRRVRYFQRALIPFGW